MSGALNYAEALFSLSEEMSISDGVLSDLTLASGILSEYPEYVKLLDTPAVSVTEKLPLIDEAFSSVADIVKNVIKILTEKHSVHLFFEIAKEYTVIYNESRGICTAEIITAVELTDSQTQKLKEKLENMTGKTIIIKNTVDKSILGGIKLRYLGKELDGTLKARLNAIEKSLKNTII
ncbi:MAG: ATP synthase F1 subunit delta [Ruminococcaceae bacterium]|nr:ATP synthase F1 subunit delta [Oscillospiraceae bacterium]